MLLVSSAVFLWLLAGGASASPARASASTARGNQELTILGGEDIAANDLDYVVGITIAQKNSRSLASCSGSIISSIWVLSAGHCFADASPLTHDVTILLGAKRLREAQRVLAEKWIVHEQYREQNSPTLVTYDIALVKSRSPLIQFRNTAIAQLPRPLQTPPPNGSTVTVAGYGIEGQGSLATERTGVAKKADMTVNGQCTNTLPYCIRAVAKTGRACSGDSGGPMVYNNEVVGVSSTGQTCTTSRGDAQYTMVSPYISWIWNKITRG